MLIIVSGSDRAGKSTLIEKCTKVWSQWPEEKIERIHFGPVPDTYPDVLGYHKKPILNWLKSDKTICFLDRSYVCLHLLGPLRHNHTGHFDLIIDYELWLKSLQIDVVHVGLIPPWSKIAQRHVSELNSEGVAYSNWRIRNQYISRMNEHSRYNRDLLRFYEEVTMFPSVAYKNPQNIDPNDLFTVCETLLDQ